MKERRASPMELHFAKLHGTGNDFVFVDDLSRDVELTAEQVRFLCDRHFGIGADGVVLVRPSDDVDCVAHMHYINADGSLSQMCGNGVRCFAKYLVDRGYVSPGDKRLTAGTLAGPKPISFEVDENEKLVRATVDMGRPVLDPALVPVAARANAKSAQGVAYVRDVPVDSPWGTFSFTCVSMGNPHAVCFVDDWEALPDALFPDAADKRLATLEVDKVGAFYERSPLFPERANIEFAAVGEEGIDMRVFERGCGETLACGTGACAVNVAASLTGRAGRENDLHLRGGTLHIVWNDDDRVLMTGPATEVYQGTVEL